MSTNNGSGCKPEGCCMELKFGEETALSSGGTKMGFLENLDLKSTILQCVGNILANTNAPQLSDLFRRDRAVMQYTLKEVKEHSDITSCWLVISDKVYDVTEFLSKHPGGEEIILENAGIDATIPFNSKGHSTDACSMMEKYCIGELVESDRRYKT